MRKALFLLVGVVIVFFVIVFGSKAEAGSDVLSDPSKRAEIEKVLTQIHELDMRKFVVFADGTIHSVRAPQIGKSMGFVNLWHCFHYKPVMEWNVDRLLGARVVGELEHDEYPALAARYDVQCYDEKTQTKIAVKIGVWAVTVLLGL